MNNGLPPTIPVFTTSTHFRRRRSFKLWVALFLLIGIAASVFYATRFPFVTLSGADDKPIGHWVTADGKTHYYFDQSSFAMIDSGSVRKGTYSVIEEDKHNARSVRIAISGLLGFGHVKELVYAPDRRSLVETVTFHVGGIDTTHTTTWHYVDAARVP